MVARGLVLESIGTKQNGTQEFVMQMEHDQKKIKGKDKTNYNMH